MDFLLQLAGKARLNDIGIGQSGRPLQQSDLSHLADDVENILATIGENGLYDVYGAPGTVTGRPVRVDEIDGLRRQVGDKWRTAKKAGELDLARRHGDLIKYIDDKVMIAENLHGPLQPENLRNLEIARAYTKDAHERFGPDSPIGRFLYGKERFDEEFLQSFISPGTGSGARAEAFSRALTEPQRPLDDAANVTWEPNPAASFVLREGDPNVIEAELLRRFTESVGPNGVPTERNVHNFLKNYGEAVDRIDGLRGKFENLSKLQQAVDVMSAKLTTPTPEQVLAAVQRGGTSADVETAMRLLNENLASVRYKRIASEYIRADVDEMAQTFIRNAAIEGTGPNSFAASKADELANLLAKDESGFAIEGFREALWRALRDSSRNYNKDKVMQPGIDTAKLTAKIQELDPFLRRFFDDNSMELLHELVKGGPLQRAGTLAETTRISPQDVLAGRGSTWGQTEVVSAAGRIGGQQIFGLLGINPLVATGMGRRIAAYTFSKVGEEGIYKIVGEALRDPVKAAELIKRYRELPDWLPPVKEKVEPILADPKGAAGEAFAEGKGQFKRAAAFVGNVVAKYSLAATQRAVALGLLPAQREATAMTVEQDWEKGAPYIYRDNQTRAYIEAMDEDRGRHAAAISNLTGAPPISAPPETAPQALPEPAAVSPPNQRRLMSTPINREVVPGSSMDGAPVIGGRSSPDVMSMGQRLWPHDSLFTPQGFDKGGIVSLPCKPRQLVG